jgi:hypothetical protein
MYDNMTRRERGEPELPMDELHSSIKWPTLGEDGMLPALLAANELTASVQYSIDVSCLSRSVVFTFEISQFAGFARQSGQAVCAGQYGRRTRIAKRPNAVADNHVVAMNFADSDLPLLLPVVEF